MGRAWRLTKGLPTIACTSGIFSSGNRPNRLSSPTYPDPHLVSPSGQETMVNLRLDAVGSLLVRFHSIGTEGSESEWPETEDDNEPLPPRSCKVYEADETDNEPERYTTDEDEANYSCKSQGPSSSRQDRGSDRWNSKNGVFVRPHTSQIRGQDRGSDRWNSKDGAFERSHTSPSPISSGQDGSSDRLYSKNGAFERSHEKMPSCDGLFSRGAERRGSLRLDSKNRALERSEGTSPHSDRLYSRDAELRRPSNKARKQYIKDSDDDYIEIESDLEGELQEEIERQMAAEPKFHRPSVTWGILLAREDRLVSRATVLEYLKSEGINTEELKPIELPTTVEVMQTRLAFLRKLGLDNDAINNYPLILGCSVRKNMVPVLRYLRKIGMPSHCMAGLLRKYPMILHASVVIDILPVIYFLKGLDIDSIDLPRVLTRYPDVLGFRTDGTMSTSVAYLVSIGVTPRHVGRMLTDYPEVLGMRVASVIKPKVDYLVSLGIPQMIVAKILERRAYILGYDLENRMQYNVSQLLEAGVRKEAIPGMVAQFPEILGRVFTSLLVSKVDWFKQTLELDSDGVARIIEQLPQVVVMQTSIANERVRFLTSAGFTAKEVGEMATNCPQILVSSINEMLRRNLAFLKKEMKRPLKEVVDYPNYVLYDLERRIRPRFRALTDKNAQCSLEWLLNCSDGEFKKRLNEAFEGDEIAGHAFVMGGLLPKRLVQDEDESLPIEQRRFAAM